MAVDSALSSPLGPPACEKDAKALQLIEEMTRNADLVQENVLAEILTRNAHTEYLMRCKLNGSMITKKSRLKPTELLKSNTEYTEEDVTEEVVKGRFPSESHDEGPFTFLGLHNDIESIERRFFGGITSLFEAAEGMRNCVFDAFGEPHDTECASSPSFRRK